MKSILLVSLLLGCLFHSLIGQDDCYLKLRNDGKALFARNEYDRALKKYLAALNCDQINQVEIAKLITKAQRARENELIKERTAAEVNSLNAQSILQNKQRKNPTKACDYAFQAWQKDPNDLYSWGNFLEAYYSQVYPWQKQYYANPFAETYYQGSSLTASDLSPSGKVFVTGAADPPIIKLWTRGGEDVLSFLGFTKTISRLHFSPDGTSIAIASLDGKARLLNADGSIKAYLFGHQSSLLDIAFSADGQRIVTASIDNSAIIWNAISGDSVCRLIDSLQSPLRTAQFSRDSKLIITAHIDGHANIWDVTGKHLHFLSHGSDILTSATFLYQGKYCITVSEDKMAKIWTSQGQLIDSISHPQKINGVEVAPNDSFVVTYSHDGLVKIWNWETKVEQSLQAHLNAINGVRFSSDGNYFLTFSDDQSIKIWSLKGEQLVSLGGFTGAVLEAGFSENDQLVYASSWDNSAKIFPLRGHKVTTYPKPTEQMQAISLSPRGDKILGISFSGAGYIWENGEVARVNLDSKTGWIYGIEFDPSSDKAVIIADSGAILWDIRGKDWQMLSHREVRSATFFTQENKLITGSNDGSVRIWNLNDYSFQEFDGREAFIHNLEISKQGSHIVTGHSNGRVALWNIDERKKEWAQGYHNGEAVNHICFSHDGLHILSSSSNNQAFIWDLQGNPINIFNHSGAVLSASFSQNDQFVLTNSSDGTAKYWKVDQKEREALKTFKMPSTATVAVFSTGEKFIVTGCKDGIVRFWSMNGRLLFSLPASKGAISHIQLSPHNDWLITIGSNGRIHKWNLNPRQLFKPNEIINRY